jgi:hypothetical protein
MDKQTDIEHGKDMKEEDKKDIEEDILKTWTNEQWKKAFKTPKVKEQLRIMEAHSKAFADLYKHKRPEYKDNF